MKYLGHLWYQQQQWQQHLKEQHGPLQQEINKSRAHLLCLSSSQRVKTTNSRSLLTKMSICTRSTLLIALLAVRSWKLENFSVTIKSKPVPVETVKNTTMQLRKCSRRSWQTFNCFPVIAAPQKWSESTNLPFLRTVAAGENLLLKRKLAKNLPLSQQLRILLARRKGNQQLLVGEVFGVHLIPTHHRPCQQDSMTGCNSFCHGAPRRKFIPLKTWYPFASLMKWNMSRRWLPLTSIEISYLFYQRSLLYTFSVFWSQEICWLPLKPANIGVYLPKITWCGRRNVLKKASWNLICQRQLRAPGKTDVTGSATLLEAGRLLTWDMSESRWTG